MTASNWPSILPDELAFAYACRAQQLPSMPRPVRAIWTYSPRKKFEAETLQGGLELIAPLASRSVEDLVLRHTLIPARGWITQKAEGSFLDEFSSRQFARRMFPPAGGRLQYCTACADEDVEFWRCSYWRRIHQLPGVAHCPKHGLDLIRVPIDGAIPTQPHHIQARTIAKTRASSLEKRLTALWDALLELQRPIHSRRVRVITKANGGVPYERFGKLTERVTDQAEPTWLAHYFTESTTRTATSPEVRAALVLAASFEDIDELLLQLVARSRTTRNKIELNEDAKRVLEAFGSGVPLADSLALAGTQASAIEDALRRLTQAHLKG